MAASGGHWAGGAFVATAGSEVMTFETFAAKRDAGRFAWDVATQRLPRASKGQADRIRKEQARVQQEQASRRDQARVDYAQMVQRGQIRPPTRTETLIQKARGHEDNASVQAARRMLKKQGIKW